MGKDLRKDLGGIPVKLREFASGDPEFISDYVERIVGEQLQEDEEVEEKDGQFILRGKVIAIKCAGCGEPILAEEPIYAVQSGSFDISFQLAREDLQSEFFHIGHCLCHEDHHRR